VQWNLVLHRTDHNAGSYPNDTEKFYQDRVQEGRRAHPVPFSDPGQMPAVSFKSFQSH
jgi:hypothetical protein